MRYAVYSKATAGAWLLLLTGLLTCASPVFGQVRVVHAPSEIHTEQSVNFFLEMPNATPLDGTYLAIPASWTLENVSLINKYGRTTEVAFRSVEGTINRFYLIPPRRIVNSDRMIVGVRTGDLDGSYSFRTTPFKLAVSGFESRYELLPSLSLRHEVQIDRPRYTSANSVLEFSDQPDGPLQISNVDFSSLSSFTVEMWIKTSAVDATVLSTWNGEENSAYPFELVLDAGHVLVYRGIPGEHRSVRSSAPVADGTWHHIAVSHSDDTRWTRLYIDGYSSDSLYHKSLLPIRSSSPLVLGGRPVDQQDSFQDESTIRGYIDEIRIWTGDRKAIAIREAMRQHLPSQEGVLEVVGFESTENNYLSQTSDALATTQSNLSFYEPIRDLDVSLDVNSVLLEWEGIDPNVESYIVERSKDGMTYESLQKIEVRRGDLTSSLSNTSRFRDLTAPIGVAFYRIRQIFSDGMETFSPAVKIGMGSDDDNVSGLLTGNFPNPFNPTTTITYLIREAQHVEVSIWDLSGQMISMLVDSRKDQGEHQVQFDATDLPSGTYFVRMRTNEGVQTRQIILMK